MSDSPQGGAEVIAPSKKKFTKKSLLLVVAALLVAAAGAGGFFVYRARAAAAEAAKPDKEKPARHDKDGGEAKQDDVEEEDDNVKEVVELQPFIVNLADEQEPRYLRMTVSLGLDTEGGGEAKPDPLFTTKVRNALLNVMTTKRSQDVLTVEGKALLRKQLLSAARAAADEPRVSAIYITDFIVQL